MKVAFLITIYDKSEDSTITKANLQRLAKTIFS